MHARARPAIISLSSNMQLVQHGTATACVQLLLPDSSSARAVFKGIQLLWWCSVARAALPYASNTAAAHVAL